MSYNGFANYETWNVALWIGNDEVFYSDAHTCSTYKEFVACVEAYGSTITPDEVSWTDPTLDTKHLDEVIASL